MQRGDLQAKWRGILACLQQAKDAAVARCPQAATRLLISDPGLGDEPPQGDAKPNERPAVHLSGTLVELREQAKRLLAIREYGHARYVQHRADALEVREMEDEICRAYKAAHRALDQLTERHLQQRQIHDEHWDTRERAATDPYDREMKEADLRLQKLDHSKEVLMAKLPPDVGDLSS
jgi:hypothetical protein